MIMQLQHALRAASRHHSVSLEYYSTVRRPGIIDNSMHIEQRHCTTAISSVSKDSMARTPGIIDKGGGHRVSREVALGCAGLSSLLQRGLPPVAAVDAPVVEHDHHDGQLVPAQALATPVGPEN